MFKLKFKKLGYLFFLIISVSSILSYHVFAQDDKGVTIPTDDEKMTGIFLHLFPPSTIANLKRYGVLRFLGYMAVIVIGVMVFQTIFIIVKTAIEFASDDAKDLKEGLKTSQTIWQGLGWTFATLMIYGAISLFFGASNMFKWPSKLAQCGNGKILFKAEYEASVVSPDLFDGEVMIYCCNNFEKGPNELEDGGDEESLTIHAFHDWLSDDYEGVVVGNEERGGWLFISNPKRVEESILPEDIMEVNSCEEYTI